MAESSKKLYLMPTRARVCSGKSDMLLVRDNGIIKVGGAAVYLARREINAPIHELSRQAENNVGMRAAKRAFGKL